MNPKIKELTSTVAYGSTAVFGTYSDKRFDDLSSYRNLGVAFVSSVKVWHGDVIDCVEFVYDGRQYDKGASPFFHGGKNGSPEEFKLGMGDFIRTIEGEYGRYPYSTELGRGARTS